MSSKESLATSKRSAKRHASGPAPGAAKPAKVPHSASSVAGPAENGHAKPNENLLFSGWRFVFWNQKHMNIVISKVREHGGVIAAAIDSSTTHVVEEGHHVEHPDPHAKQRR